MAGVVCAAAVLPAPSSAGAASRGRDGPQLFVAGKLANYDYRPLEAARAGATILATESAHSGVANIEIAIDGKGSITRRFACRPTCASSGRFRFTYEARRYGPGRHKVTITATNGVGRKAR